jgi:hypothetical protein
MLCLFCCLGPSQTDHKRDVCGLPNFGKLINLAVTVAMEVLVINLQD